MTESTNNIGNVITFVIPKASDKLSPMEASTQYAIIHIIENQSSFLS
jgi:hypothetical protein